MEVTFLGTGTSHGVPTLDCMLDDYHSCPRGVCKEALSDTRLRRTRTSILVTADGFSLLVDVSMDFREQMLRERVRRIDAVCMTHGHADHIGGIPDIRSYTRKMTEPLALYGSTETLDAVQSTFSYIFAANTFVGGGIPRLTCRPVDKPFTLGPLVVTPIPVTHGNLGGCFGYRIGNLVYIPDMKSMNDESKALCHGADVLILNCLRDTREHVSHMILPESIALAKELSPRRCYFIHLTHDIHTGRPVAGLESWMAFAHDGERITVT